MEYFIYLLNLPLQNLYQFVTFMKPFRMVLLSMRHLFGMLKVSILILLMLHYLCYNPVILYREWLKLSISTTLSFCYKHCIISDKMRRLLYIVKKLLRTSYYYEPLTYHILFWNYYFQHSEKADVSSFRDAKKLEIETLRLNMLR